MPDGIIICKHSNHYDVETADGLILSCTARKKCGTLVCGDSIKWEPLEESTGVITALNDRKNLLSRPDRRGALKAIASNIDQLFVVVSKQPNEKLPDIDRYLLASELLSIDAVIVLNKIDLLTSAELEKFDEQLSHYAPIGYQTIHTSVKESNGLDNLRQQLIDKSSIFIGQSGVGKSSIVQALFPDESIRIGKLSTATGLGKHTTSVSRLYHLPESGSIIDSPGIREFTLWEMSPDQVASGFREFLPYHGLCQFNDCLHHTEPGCAIREALNDGKIDTQRYQHYIEILEEMKISSIPKY